MPLKGMLAVWVLWESSASWIAWVSLFQRVVDWGFSGSFQRKGMLQVYRWKLVRLKLLYCLALPLELRVISAHPLTGSAHPFLHVPVPVHLPGAAALIFGTSACPTRSNTDVFLRACVTSIDVMMVLLFLCKKYYKASTSALSSQPSSASVQKLLHEGPHTWCRICLWRRSMSATCCQMHKEAFFVVVSRGMENSLVVWLTGHEGREDKWWLCVVFCWGFFCKWEAAFLSHGNKLLKEEVPA